MSRALIDGDIIVYRCASALKLTTYKAYTGDGELIAEERYRKDISKALEGVDDELKRNLTIEIYEDYADVNLGYYNVREMLKSICRALNTTEYVLYVTGKDNFREEVATTHKYKGNRPERPRFYQEIKDYVWSLPGVVVSDGCEADDMLGIACMNGEGTICTLDKDLDMIPGPHYNFVDDVFYDIPEDVAIANFYRQLLTGDPTDNIVGLRGVGKKTAEKVILFEMSEEEMYASCLKMYLKHTMKTREESEPSEDSLNEVISRINENGKLLWIWRTPNDLWKPPIEDPLARDMMRTMND